MFFQRFLAFTFAAMFAVAGATPFGPVYQGTKTISCGTSSTATALATNFAGQLVPFQVVVRNKGSASADTVFVEFGDSSGITAAVANGQPVLASAVEIFTVAGSTTHIACISGSGTQTTYASIGKGD